MAFEIVYIDDEPVICEIFLGFFGRIKGLRIQTYCDPELALAAIAKHPVDLVFIDYRLPNMTGIDVAHRIPQPTQLVLVTGELSVKLQPPFQKVFSKPFDFKEMGDFIHNQIQSKITATQDHS